VFNEFLRLVQDASGWAYAIVLGLALLDAVLPIVPSEAAVITAGVVAATGGMNLELVIVAAAVGAFLGTTPLICSATAALAKARRNCSRQEEPEVPQWADRQANVAAIAVARFIPGGRTAVTLSAGTLHFPWRRFAVFDVIAAVLWAVYAALLGFFGGQAFEGAAWKGLLVALVTGLALTGVIEVVRWLLKRRQDRRTQPPEIRKSNASGIGSTDAELCLNYREPVQLDGFPIRASTLLQR
jgi:membrane protein DedA with SNARE-associated domain